MKGLGAGRIAIAAFVVCLCAASAGADSAYWTGQRSEFWDEGINEDGPVFGKSNWHSGPHPASVLRDPPKGTARFPRVSRKSVVIRRNTRTGTIIFEDGIEDGHEFAVVDQATLTVFRKGIINRFGLPWPRFLVRGGRLRFKGKARIVGAGGDDAGVQIQNTIGGRVIFEDNSRGGTAEVFNDAKHNEGIVNKIIFKDRASAGRMFINNLGVLEFKGRSNPGRALITSAHVLRLSHTRGRKGDRQITAGIVESLGSMRLGKNTLTVGRLGLFKNGRVHFHVGRRTGRIVVNGPAELGGDLTIHARAGDVAPRTRYVLIRSKQQLAGRFDKLKVASRALRKRNPKLRYKGGDVILLLDPLR